MNTIARVAFAGALVACAPAGAAELRPSLEDRSAIGDLVTGVGLHADQHEWERLQASFAPEVTIDYTSLFGGDVQTTSRDALVTQWRGLLPGFETTQHQITNIEVSIRDRDHATARSYVRATHRIGRELWIVGGLYTHDVTRMHEAVWQITSMRFTLAFEEGDRALVEKATARALAAR